MKKKPAKLIMVQGNPFVVTNDKPFMTYDKLMSGAMGKPAPKQGN